MSKGCRGRGIRQIVRRNIDCLYRSNGAVPGRGDALLKSPHLRLKRRLIAHGARHSAKERGYLGARLCETEYVVNEEKHIPASLIPKILRHRKSGQPHAHSCPGRFVHLAEHHHGLLNHSGLCHFMIQIIALSGPFPDAGEDRISAVFRRNIGDQLLNQNGLAYSRAAEQPNLAALLIRAEQINHLDSGFQNFRARGLLQKFRRPSVNRSPGGCGRRRHSINRLSQNIEHSSKRFVSYRHRNRTSGSFCSHAPPQAVRGSHRNTSYGIVSQMLRHFDGQLPAFFNRAVRGFRYTDRVIDCRKFSSLKTDIQNGAYNLCNDSLHFFCQDLSHSF